MRNENNGLINRKYLGVLSREFLETLEENGISSHEALQRMLGESFKTKDGFVQLEARPSGRDIIPTEIAHTISYIVEGLGIPIEVRMNPLSRYSRITVKSIDSIPSYTPFLQDSSGNYIQETRFDFSFNQIKRRLEKLTN